MVVAVDYTHPMLRGLGVAAGVAAVYRSAKAIRRWNRP
jgi:hypothetical protein